MPKIKIQDSPERSPSPVAKRPRAALNFSIESIMRPSECKTFNQHDSTPSPSSSTSSLSPGSSQNSPPISPGVHDNLSQHAEHHRASTSIASPPCHPIRTKTTKSAAVASTKTALDLFECRLDNLDLWHRFHPLGTEMIITKQGRRMFPPVRVTFSLNDQLLHHHHQQQATGCNQQQQLQLNPRDKYQVLMDIRPYDKKRYRYAYHKSSWQAAGKSDPPSPTKLFLHPDGPFTLDQLKRQVISFEKIKLTNSDGNKHGYIVLNSMHKYQPRIHLILWRGKESQNLANAPVALLEHEVHKTFIFSETIFTAVTAYQNHSITKLKIDSNPFAKGFRDSTRLTDLELESMHDLIADGQCPFSPPRAPPPGFPHFLFAAAQQPPHYNNTLHPHHHPHQAFGTGLPPPPPPYQFLDQPPGGAPTNNHIGRPNSNQTGEDAAAALLRERTIMALDSFLQQQQQQQQQQQSSSSVSPHQLTAAGKRGATSSPNSLAEQLRSGSSEPTNGNNCNQSNKSASAIPPPPTSNQSFNPAFGSAFAISGPPQPPPPPHLLGPIPPPPTSQATAAAISQNQLEQFIMQQQQFAAAMAAAAASGVHNQAHHNQHSAYQLQSLFAQVVQQQKCQQGPPVGSTTPTSQQQALGELDNSSPPANRQMAPAAINTNNSQQQHQEQTSPIGLAKSANRQLQLDLNQFLGHHNKNNSHHLHQVPITSTAGGNTAHHINQQHTIQAFMQQQHQMQQMAALAQSQTNNNNNNNNHLNHLNHLQMEPLLGLQEAGLVSRRATKNK